MKKRETVKTAIHFDLNEWVWLKRQVIRELAEGQKSSIKSLVHEGIELVRRTRSDGICPACGQKLPAPRGGASR